MGFSFGSLLGSIGTSVGDALTGGWMGNSARESLAKNTLRTANAINYDYAMRSARELPSAQVAGLRAAGINPIAAYGGISGSGVSFGNMGDSSPTVRLNTNLADAASARAAQADADVKDSPLYKAGEKLRPWTGLLQSLVGAGIGAATISRILGRGNAPAPVKVAGFQAAKAATKAASNTAKATQWLGSALRDYLPSVSASGAAAAAVHAWREHRDKVGGRNERALLHTPAHVLSPLR